VISQAFKAGIGLRVH